MDFTQAIARKPGPDFARGVTGIAWDKPPDYRKICRQHDAYIEALAARGLDVHVLAPEPDFPDSYFVEDVAVMLPETALITRPGDLSRRREPETITRILARHKPLEYIVAPGRLDGGDVMQVEGHFYIGLSQRTNKKGAQQLGQAAERQGFTWSTIAVPEALHLKTGVNYLGKNCLLMFEAYDRLPEFGRFNRIIVEKDEISAANTLLINDTLLTPEGCPKTLRKLKTLGMPITQLDMSEVIKMDGGLSCLSLRF